MHLPSSLPRVQQQAPLLQRLIRDILSMIISYVDHKDRCHVARTCQDLHVVAQLQSSKAPWAAVTINMPMAVPRFRAMLSPKTSTLLVLDNSNQATTYDEETSEKLARAAQVMDQCISDAHDPPIQRALVQFDNVICLSRMRMYMLHAIVPFRRSLRTLALSRCILTRDNVSQLQQLSSLQILFLDSCSLLHADAWSMTTPGAPRFPANLTALFLSRCFAHDDGWTKLLLGGCKLLRLLHVHQTPVRPTDMERLQTRTLPQLDELHLTSPHRTDKAFFESMRGLRVRALTLRLCDLRADYDNCFDMLKTLPELCMLGIHTDGGLRWNIQMDLSCLPKLHTLQLTSPDSTTAVAASSSVGGAIPAPEEAEEQEDVETLEENDEIEDGTHTPALWNEHKLRDDVQNWLNLLASPVHLASDRPRAPGLASCGQTDDDDQEDDSDGASVDHRLVQILDRAVESKTLRTLRISTPRLESLFPTLRRAQQVEYLAVARAPLHSTHAPYIAYLAQMTNLRVLDWLHPMRRETLRVLVDSVPQLHTLSVRLGDSHDAYLTDVDDQVVASILAHKNLKKLSVRNTCGCPPFIRELRQQLHEAGIEFGCTGLDWE